MTALNLTPDQERIAAVDWAEREYRNVDVFTGHDLDIAIKAYIAGRRAALAQSPVSTEGLTDARIIELARQHLDRGLYHGTGKITHAIDSELIAFVRAATDKGMIS